MNTLESQIRAVLNEKKVKSVFVNKDIKLVTIKLQKYERKMPIFLSGIEIENIEKLGLKFFFANFSKNELTFNLGEI